MNRRQLLKYSFAGLSTLALAPSLKAAMALAADQVHKLVLSNNEWKKRLTPEQYAILREEDTEAPFTSPLLNEHRDGTFVCAACNLPLFPSKFKYDSGTGWPSFFDTIPGHLGTKDDYRLLVRRTEYHCERCGGHHGHVFDDGPAPTGLRYCNNGAVLKFLPKEA